MNVSEINMQANTHYTKISRKVTVFQKVHLLSSDRKIFLRNEISMAKLACLKFDLIRVSRRDNPFLVRVEKTIAESLK